MKCYLHKECFFPWQEMYAAIDRYDLSDMGMYGKDAPFWMRHEIQEHIATDELKLFKESPIGPATAIARLHTLRSEGKFKEADTIKNKYNIQVYKGGYAALNKKW